MMAIKNYIIYFILLSLSFSDNYLLEIDATSYSEWQSQFDTSLGNLFPSISDDAFFNGFLNIYETDWLEETVDCDGSAVNCD